MRKHSLVLLAGAFAISLFGAGFARTQITIPTGQPKDPGPRGAPIGAGQPVAGLTADQLAFFNDGAARFSSPDTVPTGLGPLFNATFCAQCHSQPAVGGSSPSAAAFPFIGPNPQVADAMADGATNTLPPFITADGPVREARFLFVPNANGTNSSTPDGGVHDLFSITGRSDAAGCQLAQPDFAQAIAQKNIIFRIPTPTFGLGLIENIYNETIVANANSNAALKAALGINGHPNSATPNVSGNTGSITRSGWKAQNPSGGLFSGEAYSVEVGVSNEIFTVEREEPPAFSHPLPPGCILNSYPEDTTNFLAPGSDVTQIPSDIVAFANFMRLLDQPAPAPLTLETAAGKAAFVKIGCALCHTPSLMTGESDVAPALSHVQANLFSDLLVHDMGTGLADGVTQGAAGPQDFRSAPLWGVGQRVFFLHDGRCGPSNGGLVCAIQAHASSGSEANGVISNFNRLPISGKQSIIDFLRSL